MSFYYNILTIRADSSISCSRKIYTDSFCSFAIRNNWNDPILYKCHKGIIVDFSFLNISEPFGDFEYKW